MTERIAATRKGMKPMTPEPIKALAELRARGLPWRYAWANATRPGLPWDIYATGTEEINREGWLVGSVSEEADAALIVEAVNAFRADPAALLSLVPRDELREASALDVLIERVRTMPSNGVISRWENVSRSAVIDLLLEARARLAASPGEPATPKHSHPIDRTWWPECATCGPAREPLILNRDTGSAEPGEGPVE